MLLFESSNKYGKFDIEWAKKNYQNYNDSSKYLQDLFSKYYQKHIDESKGIHVSHKLGRINANRYILRLQDYSDPFRSFTADELNHFGRMIKEDKFLKKFISLYDIGFNEYHINADGKEQTYDLVINYDIENDLDRWDYEHQVIDDFNSMVNNFDVKPYIPNDKDWLYMINTIEEKKNPKQVFSYTRIKNDRNRMVKQYLIALKLNWDEAIGLLMSAIRSVGITEFDYHGDVIIEAMNNFAKEYEIPKHIQEIIEDYKQYSSKGGFAQLNKSKIDQRYTHIIKALDNNEMVENYEFDELASLNDNDEKEVAMIKITCVNGNTNTVIIERFSVGVNQFQFKILNIDGYKRGHDIQFDYKSGYTTLSYLAKYVKGLVDSIYYKDLNLNTITLKIH